MQISFCIILTFFAVALTKRCCPPNKQLHPLLTCPANPAPLRRWDSPRPAIKPIQDDFFTEFNETEACIDWQKFGVNESPNDWGLPHCPSHSLVSVCNVDNNDNISFLHHTHNSTVCAFGNCYTEKSREMTLTIAAHDTCSDGSTTLYCPCLHSVCIRKCCPSGQLYDDLNGECIRNNSVMEWTPYLEKGNLSNNYFLLPNSFPPQCDAPHLLKIPLNYIQYSNCFSHKEQEERNQFKFNEDGSVQINKYKFPFNQESYCGEHTLHEDGSIILNNLLICLPQETQNNPRPFKFNIYGALLLIGGCFLALTVLISCYLPELRGTLYHRVTICHNVALMVASFIWGTANLMPSITYATCVVFSLVIQFTFLASFFWMNVMCIDIALAFKNLRSVYGPTGDKGWSRFFQYSAYAWGTPLFLTAITATMELLPPDIDILVRPGFGCGNCGFNSDTYAILVYFYGPIIFILLFNLILFIMTLLKIRQVEKQTAILKSKGGVNKSLKCCPDTQRLILFGKMFILMGLTWGTEVIGWWLGGPAAYWYLPDVINFLRAVFLFVVFVAKPSVWSSLRQKISGKKDTVENSRTRRSKSSSVERREAEAERRGRILAKQITQTFRLSTQVNDC